MSNLFDTILLMIIKEKADGMRKVGEGEGSRLVNALQFRYALNSEEGKGELIEPITYLQN